MDSYLTVFLAKPLSLLKSPNFHGIEITLNKYDIFCINLDYSGTGLRRYASFVVSAV